MNEQTLKFVVLTGDGKFCCFPMNGPQPLPEVGDEIVWNDKTISWHLRKGVPRARLVVTNLSKGSLDLPVIDACVRVSEATALNQLDSRI